MTIYFPAAWKKQRCIEWLLHRPDLSRRVLSLQMHLTFSRPVVYQWAAIA